MDRNYSIPRVLIDRKLRLNSCLIFFFFFSKNLYLGNIYVHVNMLKILETPYFKKHNATNNRGITTFDE